MNQPEEIKIALFPEGTENTIPRFKDEFSIPVMISNRKDKRTLFHLSPYRYKNRALGLECFGNAIALIGQKDNGEMYIDVYRCMLTPSIVHSAKKLVTMS